MSNVLASIAIGDAFNLTLDSSPCNGNGISAPVGSIAYCIDGCGIFYKYGSADTQWKNLYGSYNYNFDYVSIKGQLTIYSAFEDIMDIVTITNYDDTAILSKIHSNINL